MDVFDEVSAANAAFAQSFGLGELPAPPSRHLAIVTCMDARIVPLQAFGLDVGDAHVIRNAGGRVTDDVLRSLIVSTHVLGVRAVAVVHHTECGMAKVSDDELRARVREATGKDPVEVAFHAIGDMDVAVANDVLRLRDAGLLYPGTQVRGYVYDVRSGRLREVGTTSS